MNFTIKTNQERGKLPHDRLITEFSKSRTPYMQHISIDRMTMQLFHPNGTLLKMKEDVINNFDRKTGLSQANLGTWSPHLFSTQSDQQVPVPLLGHRASSENEKVSLGKRNHFNTMWSVIWRITERTSQVVLLSLQAIEEEKCF